MPLSRFEPETQEEILQQDRLGRRASAECTPAIEEESPGSVPLSILFLFLCFSTEYVLVYSGRETFRGLSALRSAAPFNFLAC